jgi:hypothetical protein
LDNVRIYDGWYKHRYVGDDWVGVEEEKSISIPVEVVNHPRDPEDEMEEIPVGGIVHFRTRLVIYLDDKPEFPVPEEEEATSGIIYFSIGGTRFQYQFVREFDFYVIREEDFEGAIDLSADGRWRLIIDKNALASVSWDAPDVGTFSVPDIEVNLLATPMWVSEVIPASTGGTVVVNIVETNVTVNVLVVPPKALPEDTTITVTQKPRENLTGYVMVSEIFEIGPSGTTFTEPSTLTLPYDENKLPEGVSEESLAIYRCVGNNWEYLGGVVNTSANTVSTEIDRLSEYAVMARLPVGVPLPYILLVIMVVFTGSLVAILWKHFMK